MKVNSTSPPKVAGPAPDFGAADDRTARRHFRRNRYMATGLLAGMAAVFVATLFVKDPGFTVLLVRAASEAGVVGGLADWFAVTALFHHPLGLPIPHTAILPSSKDRIAQSLGSFIERNFLTPEVIVARLRGIGAGRRFANWLSQPSNAAAIAGTVASALPYLVRSLENRDLLSFANRTLGRQLAQSDFAPLLGRIIRALTSSGEADVLFDHGILLAERLIKENSDHIERLAAERSRWWIPRSVDKRIAGTLISGVLDVLYDLQQPESDARIQFRAALTDFADSLETSPELRDQVNAIKDRLLGHPDVQAWLASIWSDISAATLADLEAPSSVARAGIEQIVLVTGQALAEDEAMVGKLDAATERLALYVVNWRSEIGSLFSDVIHNWDARTFSDRLETVVGSDLQYIRINGTIVGAIVGCLLFLATHFLVE